MLDKVVARPGTIERLAAFLYGTPSLRVWHQLDQIAYLTSLYKLENNAEISLYDKYLHFNEVYWSKYGKWSRPVSSHRLWIINSGLREMIYTESYISLAEIAIALGMFQSANGEFPDALEDLVPDYFAEIPMDTCSGNSLLYKKTDQGYLIYSVGLNRIDENGHSGKYEDGTYMEGDDITIKYP